MIPSKSNQKSTKEENQPSQRKKSREEETSKPKSQELDTNTIDQPKVNSKEALNEDMKEDEETKKCFDDINKEAHVKICIIGNVDSGKSTLVGVLTKGMYDDGRGSARQRVFNFAHEAQNGRTSSIAHEIMGFDDQGKRILADRFVQNKNKYWAEIVKKSTKIVTLLDLCGHEKYLKTTMFGLVGLIPDFSMIIVGANMGVSRMTKEHLGITLALKIPFFVVLTKVDMCPENVLKESGETLMTILKSGGVNRKPIVVKTEEDIKTCAETLSTDRICPIFYCSSVSGEGVDSLISFISLLKNRDSTNKLLRPPTDPVQFDINENFMVSGVGVVVSGIMKAGTVKANSVLLLGPDKADTYRPVTVKSVHVNRVSAEKAISGQFACLAIRPTNKKDLLTRDDFRKGMILIDPLLRPEPIWEFDADVIILHHATTIQPGYQSVLHCGVIRQAVTVLDMSKDVYRTGDKGLIRFKFMYNSEYIKPNSTIILREGRTKILGMVTRVIDSKEKEKDSKASAIDVKKSEGKEGIQASKTDNDKTGTSQEKK